MLSALGKVKQSFIAKILFGLLTLSFLGWGISDVFQANTGMNDAAHVGKTRIPLAELDHSYQQYMNSLRARGIQIPSEQAKSMKLAESALKARIQRELFSQTSEDMGLTVNDATVAAEIQKQKIFLDDKDKFSRDKFNATLKQNGLSEVDYVESLRADTANNLLLSVLKNNATVPDAVILSLYQHQNEMRSAEIWTLPFGSVKNITPPTDEQLAAYLKDHQEEYKVPELRSFTIGLLSVPALAQSIPVSEADIQAAYELRKEELKKPEEREIQFVSLPDQKTAQNVAEAARGGDKLLAAAKAHGAKDATLQNLKNIKKGSLPPVLDKVVFSLGRAETSDAIQTPLGFYVLQVLSINRSETPSLKELHDKIKQSIQLERADTVLAKTTTDLDDAVAGGAPMDEVAKTYSLRLTDVNNVSQLGTNRDGTDNRLATTESLKTAFDLKSGQTGAVEELPNGDYMVVHLNSIQPARVPEIAEIKARLVQDWSVQERQRVARTRGEELQTAWTKNQNFEELAKKYGAVRSVLTNAKRDSKDASPDLLIALFDLKKQGNIVTGRSKNGIAVAKLTNVIRANPAQIKPEEKDTLHRALEEQAKNDLFDTFLHSAEQHHKVTINKEAVQRLYR